MSRVPASEETIKSNMEIMGITIESNTPLLCDAIKTQENLDKINLENLNTEQQKILLFWKELLRIYIYIIIESLDLSTIIRAAFRAKNVTEKKINLKYINVVIVEGYNYLFKEEDNKKIGFVPSAWADFMDSARTLEVPELVEDFFEIENLFQDFKHQYLSQDGFKNRNLATHYDCNPLKVVDYLNSIDDEDIEIRKVNSLLKINDILTIKVSKWLKKLFIPLIYRESHTRFVIPEFNSFFRDKDDVIYDVNLQMIENYARRIDNMFSTFNKAKSFIEKKCPKGLTDITDAIGVTFPVFHVLLINIDLSTVTRAFLKSEFYFEKMLNLRRINFIMYEGFKKLYGFDSNQQEQSFWEKNIKSKLNSEEDLDIKNKVLAMENMLIKMSEDSNLYNKNLRNYTVHYRYGNDDYVSNLLKYLTTTLAIVEVNKVVELIKFIPKLIKMSDMVIQKKGKDFETARQLRKDEWMSQFDDLINKANASENCTDETRKILAKARDKINDMLDFAYNMNKK